MNKYFIRAFHRYVGWRIRHGLDGVFVAGLESAIQQVGTTPVIFAATHVAFWDSMLLFPLDRVFGGGGRALMDAKNLLQLPFLKTLGAMPLDRSSSLTVQASLFEAAAWLSQPNRYLWIFPQGRQRHPAIRPLGLRRGVRDIARLSGATVIPVAIQYGFREDQRPTAVIDFGVPMQPPTTVQTWEDDPWHDKLESALVRGIDAGIGFFEQPSGWSEWIPGRGRRLDQNSATRWLAWWFSRRNL